MSPTHMIVRLAGLYCATRTLLCNHLLNLLYIIVLSLTPRTREPEKQTLLFLLCDSDTPSDFFVLEIQSPQTNREFFLARD